MYPRLYVNVALAVASLSLGCGGEAVSDMGSGGSGGAPCPNLAGTWTISTHCDPNFVGDPISVGQSGCNFTDQTFGLSGTLDANGAFTATTMFGGQQTTCTGTATASSIAQTCSVVGGTCSMSLVR
jgi:hypothetical protein